MEIQEFIRRHQLRIETVLRKQIKHCVIPGGRLQEAMQYAVLNGGKRLRPVLAYAGAQALAGAGDCADIPACAVELVHAYSLVHDDLPAMDDDVLRRGLPTCHIKFDEATAILAGDALQTLAFQLLGDSPQLAVGNSVRLKMISCLAQAIGPSGMVLGQSLDFHASGSMLDEDSLAAMHALKTGALIHASVLLGALSTGVAGDEQLDSLGRYAQCLGLAFQIQDDILDVTSDTRTLGKTHGRDQALNKPTYVSMLGLDGARARAARLCDEGIAALDGFAERADPLRALANFFVQRTH
ncbi:MAG: (2E,6E)-farnesyl diphosphate synthase [Pseudohongiellaceae bacterium]